MECLIQMAGEHTRAGIGVEAVCFDEPNAAHFTGMPLVANGLGKGYTKYAFHAGLISWLKSNLFRFDAVVIHGLWAYHSIGAWSVLHKSNVPYFVYTHGMLDPWFKHTYPFKHLKKWLFWPWADYRVLRDASAVLFTCEEERLLASKSFWLYKANERVVKFGAATPPQNTAQLRECFFSEFPYLQGKRLLLFLSRIHEKKGCDLLIEAFARVASAVPDLHLVIAGPGQSGTVAGLEALAKRLGVQHSITWTGMLRGNLKWGAFYASELFILPSHQENFGIAVAESLGCGLPVLISNKVNIWREIYFDGAGLVGGDNLEDTVNNLRCWVDKTEDDRVAMGVQARKTFLDRFTVQAMAKSLLDTINDFL